MAGKDAASGQSIVHAFNGIREPTDCMTAMGRWISAKIEELAAADARIERRMEHLAKTEESLKGLFDALRTQVAAAYPLVEDLKKLEPQAKKITEDAVRSLQAQMEQAAEEIKARPITVDTVTADVVTEEAVAVEPAVQPVPVRDELQVVASMNSAVDEIIERCEASLTAAEAIVYARWNDRIESIEERLDGRLNSFGTSVEQIGSAFDDRLREAVDTARADIAQAAASAMPTTDEDFTHPAVDRVGWLEQYELPQEDLHTLEASVSNTARTMQEVLDEASDDFRRRCLEMLASARQSVQEQIAGLSRDTYLAVTPVIDRIEQDRKLAEAQIRVACDAASETLNRRVDELRQTGEQVVELFEQRLVGRVLAMRPRAHESLATTERSLQQRLDKLLNRAEEVVTEREAQLTGRIETLRPKLLDELRALETEIRAQTEKIESQAGQMTSWLERKLTDRIDERVRRLRQLVRGELAASTESIDPTPMSDEQRVEVEVFIDKHRRVSPAAA